MNQPNAKPREFWLNKYTCEFHIGKLSDDDIHVIEYSAYEELKNRVHGQCGYPGYEKIQELIKIIKRQQETLDYYGDLKNWAFTNRVNLNTSHVTKFAGYDLEEIPEKYDSDDNIKSYFAGKKARATLAATKEELKRLGVTL